MLDISLILFFGLTLYFMAILPILDPIKIGDSHAAKDHIIGTIESVFEVMLGTLFIGGAILGIVVEQLNAMQIVNVILMAGILAFIMGIVNNGIFDRIIEGKELSVVLVCFLGTVGVIILYLI